MCHVNCNKYFAMYIEICVFVCVKWCDAIPKDECVFDKIFNVEWIEGVNGVYSVWCLYAYNINGSAKNSNKIFFS